MTYRPGDHKMICDRSGFEMYASESRKEWNGLIVRRDFWEPRHPQDFLRAVPDYQHVPDARPEQANNFITTAITPDDL